MEFIYADGGRSQYFTAANVGDCGCRAIANATGEDYMTIYNLIRQYGKEEKTGKRKKSKSNPRNGVYRETVDRIMKDLGWKWTPTMRIGSGCTTHLTEDELPSGNLVVAVSRHYTCVKDGVLYDTYDCSRDGNRCVYGYWSKPQQEPEIFYEINQCFEIVIKDTDGNILERQMRFDLDGWGEAQREAAMRRDRIRRAGQRR